LPLAYKGIVDNKYTEQLAMQYMYSTRQGLAILNKGDDLPLVRIGKFKNEQEALLACRKHYQKSCDALTNFGKPIPQAFFM